MPSHEFTAQKIAERHPLQRLKSPSRSLSAVLHIAGLVDFAYCYRFLVLNPSQVNDSYGWHMQYLTIIGITLATATFACGLLADILLSSQLFKVKNGLSITSAPMECLVSILYWGLRIIDPKLVMPDFAPPLHLPTDLCFHLFPSILLAMDLLLFSPPYTIRFIPAIILSVTIAFIYWFWIELCYSYNGFYPYPIFEVLSTPWRAVLFLFSAFMMSVSTAVLLWLYGVVNGKELEHDDRPGYVKKDT